MENTSRFMTSGRLVGNLCLFIACFCGTVHVVSAQDLQQFGGSRRPPVLVDDIRSERLYPVDALSYLDSIPSLSPNQRNRVKLIAEKYDKDIAAVERKKDQKALELVTLKQEKPDARKEIGKKMREIDKLGAKREKLCTDRRKKMRAELSKDQQSYLDRVEKR